jgi:hypothetical protein
MVSPLHFIAEMFAGALCMSFAMTPPDIALRHLPCTLRAPHHAGSARCRLAAFRASEGDRRRQALRNLVYLVPSLWLGAAAAGGALAQAQDRVREVNPPADARSLTETGSISAGETMTYAIDAKSGHSASVDFRADNAKCGFLIYGPGQTPGRHAPMFDSAVSGGSFSGFLPATGRYLVRIALAREAARNLQTCGFTITFAVAR